MLGIQVAALVASTLALLIVGGLMWERGTTRLQFALLSVLALLVLPLSPLVYDYVRLPLDGWLRGGLGAQSELYRWLRSAYAPLTEEPAKLWPLLLPWVARWIRPENAVRAAITLGLGFGLGEIWLVARLVTENTPDIAALPWYLLLGFVNERFMVCLIHGAFTAVALTGLVRGGWQGVLGVLGAMALHYIGNFPLVLAQRNAGDLGAEAWTQIAGSWVVLYFLAMIVLLAYLRYGRLQVGRLIYGEATCPECGVGYPRPLLALNLGIRRYERCPSCKHWHVV